jgi:hypothetical protein
MQLGSARHSIIKTYNYRFSEHKGKISFVLFVTNIRKEMKYITTYLVKHKLDKTTNGQTRSYLIIQETHILSNLFV